ncbi:TetR/AcrR family transcriptional regulator [Polyangium sp. 6x1]|uniref:TetR/AcrR family transcriptional regulator n=1 Tax=Polyangium sp. 6x1 TaxID=3042689 RepID=UPI002482BB95|nr:TetR/AcrR family transcriptional regulator [Polyangium sp. 6x1]MDI1451910.1 TetR/AcrR family transcriptional regulator [Polyangium sp. 6x1]
MSRPRNIPDTKILEEARACFLEHGAAVSTTLIAERLGISHGVLFQRFGTKEQLLRAALMPPSEPPWMARMRSGPDDRDARTQLHELAEEIFAYLQRIVPCLAVLRSAGMHVESAADRREDLPPVRARREMAAWFSRAIARGLLRSVPPEHAADVFLGSLQFRPFHQHLSNQGFDHAENRAYVAFAVDVICCTLAEADGSGVAQPSR